MILGSSSIPNSKIINGIHANSGTCCNAFTKGLIVLLITGEKPIPKPRTNPADAPTKKPKNTLFKLTNICEIRSPDLNRYINVSGIVNGGTRISSENT